MHRCHHHHHRTERRQRRSESKKRRTERLNPLSSYSWSRARLVNSSSSSCWCCLFPRPPFLFVCVFVCFLFGKVTLFLSHERTVDTSVKKGDSHEFEPQTKDYEQRKECVFCADKNEYLLRVVKDVRCSLLRSMYYIKIHTHLTLSLVFLSHFFCIYSNCAKLSFVFSYTSSGVAIASTFLTFPKVS